MPVIVLNLNDRPIFTKNARLPLLENSPPGTLVGGTPLSSYVWDQDGDTLHYKMILLGNTFIGAQLANEEIVDVMKLGMWLHNETGELRVTKYGAYNFETLREVRLIVLVQDDGEIPCCLKSEGTLHVDIIDTNDPPWLDLASRSFTVPENAADKLIGQLLIEEQDVSPEGMPSNVSIVIQDGGERVQVNSSWNTTVGREDHRM